MSAEEPRHPPLHPSLEPLRFLLGTWLGEGEGTFHTVEPFSYHEEIRFSDEGRVLVYHQRARSTEDDEVLHTEMGFWRLFDDGRLNAYISLTAGSDFSEGSVEGTSVRLESTTKPMAEGIERVTRLERRYEADGDTLSYEILMGTEKQPYGRHVWGRLRRVRDAESS